GTTAGADLANNVIENELYRLTFNLATGEMTGLFDKQDQWEVLAGPANIVSREEDQGDLWELYRGLDGGSYIAMTNQQSVPKPGQARFSNEYSGTNGTIRRGPVFSEFTVSHALTNGSFSTRVRLSAGIRRIDIETSLLNKAARLLSTTRWSLTRVIGGRLRFGVTAWNSIIPWLFARPRRMAACCPNDGASWISPTPTQCSPPLNRVGTEPWCSVFAKPQDKLPPACRSGSTPEL